MKREILDLEGKFFPQINVSLILCNNFSISSFYNYKDKVTDTPKTLYSYKSRTQLAQGVCAPYKALDSLRFENGLIKP